MLQLLREKLTYGFLMSVLVGCGGATATTIGSGASSSGCAGGSDPTGLNENQQAPGDQPGGVQVGIGDIAVAPGGEFVVFQRGEELAVGWISTGVVEPLPVRRPSRLAFAKGRPVVYVGSDEDHKLHAVDVKQRRALWITPLATDSWNGWLSRIASTADDTRIVAAGYNRVTLLDAASGAIVEEVNTDMPVVDVDILPDGARALVVSDHQWEEGEPSTEITVLGLEAGATTSFKVPNCADNIIVEKTGARAFLAPSTCVEPGAPGYDPISLVDLTAGSEAFVRNLPGFGPVALAPDGTTAVGFLDHENMDETLFDDPAQIPEASPEGRYFLMVIDTEDLSYAFYPVGDALPRYAMTPDGQVLLVDSAWDQPARLFDLQTGEMRAIEGAALALDNFVLTSDSSRAYVLQSGLWELDIAAAAAAQIPTDFVPQNINITPDDRTLFLRETQERICIFPLAERRCAAHLSTDLPSL